MLINPKTHEPYRYKDGTIMAFVRDRNSAFENASFGKKHTLGKSISFLRDNVYPAYNTQPLMGRKEALNDISEAGAAQREVIAHLRQEFHLEQQTTSLPPPTYQHGHSAEPLFLKQSKTGCIDVAEFGEVLFSGWGSEPPQDIYQKVDALFS